MAQEVAVIIGVGDGLSASLARMAAKSGMAVALAARNPAKLDTLAGETRAKVYRCDSSVTDDVAALFAALDREFGALDLVVFNPSARVRGPLIELDPAQVENAIRVSAFGGFLVGQQAAKRMLPRGKGSIFFSGASASVKGYPHSASFAMGKFALRGLAQSMARELAPKGIHVAHFVIDGEIAKDGANPRRERGPDGLLDPDAIAETYFHLHRQHRSAWTWEVELRPWVENF